MTILAPPTPTTRFQGSKHKLLGWLWSHLEKLPFETCLDAFAGSGCVSHFLKGQGKAVTCNDVLVSSALTATALLENDRVKLEEADVDAIVQRHPDCRYDDLIARTFDGIYFTSEENQWLDVAVQNIDLLPCRYKRAIALYALFQSALAKRPYNLFHRRNLYMRLSETPRSFGNKTTWDRPFPEHFRQFVSAANDAIFQAAPCKASCADAMDVAGEFDLVYMDPPYLNSRGISADYRGFYHFLEGLADYRNWEARIDFASKQRRLLPVRSRWENKSTIVPAFETLFDRWRKSMIAVSYRSDGIPSLDEIAGLLGRVKDDVVIHRLERRYKYALSINGGSSEAIIIGK